MRKISLPRTRTAVAKSLSLLRTRNRLAVLLIVIAASSAAAVTATSAASAVRSSVGHMLFGSLSINSPLSGNQGRAGASTLSYLNTATSIESGTNATLNSGRQGHTATLLADGRVLIAGGDIGGTAEIFNSSQGTSASTGSLTASRSDHTATRSADGRVLLMGGRDANGAALASTEIYDPTSGRFSAGPFMGAARSGQTATQLNDGRILITGGDAAGSAEIYNPATNTFSSVAATMNVARFKHSAASMQDGRVLLVGGQDAGGGELHSGEIFDGQNFSPVGNQLVDAHVRAVLRVLPDGKVQIIGGDSDHHVIEIYDPAAGIFGAHAHNINPANDDHAELIAEIMSSPSRAALLSGGQTITELPGLNKALVAGGVDSNGNPSNAATLYNSSSASVTTDVLDYAPGTPVVMTGRGWQPFEMVTLTLHEDPHTHTENVFSVQADADGNFTFDQYAPEHHDIGVSFILGARGQSSSWTAQTTFSDSPKIASITINNSPGQTPNPVTQGNSATYAFTVNRGTGMGSSGTFSACLSVFNLPTGASGTFSSGSAAFVASESNCSGGPAFTFAPATTSRSGTLTIATTAATPGGVSNFTIRAGTTASSPSDFADRTTTLNVAVANQAPTANAQSVSTDEDAALAITLSATDNDVPANTLTYSVVIGPTNGSLSGTAPNLTYMPNLNFNGSDSFTFKANDGIADSNVATVSITVNAINDAPSFTKGANQTVAEDAGAQSVANWATGISAGPTNEAAQTVDFIVGNNNNSLFSVQPTVSPTGTLNYTPAPNFNGSAVVSVQIHDDGGTANGGVNTSATQTFNITVSPLNDTPTANDGTTTTDEDVSVGIDLGSLVSDVETADASLTYEIVSNPASGQGTLTPGATNGTFTFAPAANYNGTASFTYKVTDRGDPDNCGAVNAGCTAALSSLIKTVTITINSVNDAPTANANGPYMVDEGGSTPLNGSGSDIEGDALTFNWDLDNNGSFETSGQNPTFSAAGLDGPDSKTVVLKVCDTSNACSMPSNAMVNIANVAPTATFNAPASADQGGSFNISLSNVIDPFAGDTPFEYAFDCGSGTFGVYSTTNNANCSVSGTSSLTVRGKVKDKDGGESTIYSAVVAVRPQTSLAVSSATGTFGGTVNLTATLTQTSGGAGLNGKTISFTLSGNPVCGGMTGVTCPTTNSSGVATLNNVSLSGINAGTYPGAISASFAGDSGFQPSNGSNTLTVNKAPSTVSFTTTAPATLAFGLTYTPAATTTGDGALTIGASGACSINGSGVVTMISGIGTCTVTATVAEGTNYLGSSATPQMIAATKANQTITFTGAPMSAVYNTTFNVAVSASSSLPVTITPSGVCSISGLTVTMTSGTGVCTLTASQGGNDNYNAAPDAVQMTTAQKATATFVLSDLTQTYDGNPKSATVNVTPTGLAYTVTYVGVTPTVYSASTTPPTNAGTYSVTAMVAAPDSNNYQGSSTQPFTINRKPTSVVGLSPQTLIYGNPIAQTATVSGGPGGETITYTLASGLNATTGFNAYSNLVNVGDYTLKASYAGDSNYEGSEATANIIVNKTDQTIVWNNPATITYGTALSATQLNATVTGVTGGSAPGALAYNPIAGTVLAAGNHTLSVTAAATANYNQANKDVTLTVNPANTAINAADKPATFGDSSVTLTASVTNTQTAATVSEGTVTFTVKQGMATIGSVTSGMVVGGAASASFSLSGVAAGPYQICATYNPGSNFNGSSDATPATLTVATAGTATSVSVNPASVQYSDTVTFSAIVVATNPSLNSQLTGAVQFYINSTAFGSPVAATVNASGGTASLTFNNQLAPGGYKVSAVFTSSNSNFSGSGSGVPVNPNLTITPEDARATYSGALYVSTSSATSSTATVRLAATIQDITAAAASDPAYDPNAGDIRNAKVTFVLRSGSPSTPDTALNTTPLSVVLVDSGDTKTGTVIYDWSPNIGTNDSVQYTVGIKVSGYYARNAEEDNTVVTVSKAIPGMITGGGYLVLTNSAGLKAGTADMKNNFGFNVKNDSKNASPKGNINAIIRRMESDGILHVYQIKGNAMTSLVVNSTINALHPYPTAVFNGKANIQDITNPLNPISVDGSGGSTLQVILTDKGEPGRDDTIGITLWDKSGALWFASKWDGAKTVEQMLGGGNLQVR